MIRLSQHRANAAELERNQNFRENLMEYAFRNGLNPELIFITPNYASAIRNYNDSIGRFMHSEEFERNRNYNERWTNIFNQNNVKNYLMISTHEQLIEAARAVNHNLDIDLLLSGAIPGNIPNITTGRYSQKFWAYVNAPEFGGIPYDDLIHQIPNTFRIYRNNQHLINDVNQIYLTMRRAKCNIYTERFRNVIDVNIRNLNR